MMKNSYLKKILIGLKYLIIYYISASMICFAIPKFLFMQFRVLHYASYVPLVEVSKTQHMWSFFGRSYHYNLFIGITEFLIGVFIVFRRTRLIALLMALGVCSNILILNIEFDIDFAIGHTFVDFVLIVVLLSEYYRDLYKFFIQLGGKFNHVMNTGQNIFKRYFPVFFVVVLSVSYFIFAFNLRATVNEDVVGAYKIERVSINNTPVILNNGNLGSDPMMFLEYNNQIVLSVNDTAYYGHYVLVKDSIKIRLNHPTNFQFKSMDGLIKDNNSILGEMDEKKLFQMDYTRIDGKKDYLNDLY
ncbi:hypothetical protein [Sinomicrobium sp. M5D2P9]